MRSGKLTLLLIIGIATIAFAAKPALADGYVFGFTTGGATLNVNTTSGTYNLGSVSTGWYMSNGFHDSANQNYIAGVNGPNQYNDYFSFDLSGVTGTVLSANLIAFDDLESGDPFYTLYDVSTPTAILDSSVTGATSIYADLGSGIVYGTHQVTSADDSANITISLDSDALAAIQRGEGADFSVGGSTAAAATATPEPSSLALMGTGLLGTLGILRRRYPRA